MILRDGRSADAGAIRNLIGQLSEDPGEEEMCARLDAVFAAVGHRLIVAEEGGKVEVWARQRGLTSTALYKRVDRDRARAFYERLGYRLKATSNLMARAE